MTKLEIRLYPEFLNIQICTFGPQICTLSTRTCTFCSTIASDFSASTFLPHLLTTLINLVLYKHEHEGQHKDLNTVRGQIVTLSNQVVLKGEL